MQSVGDGVEQVEQVEPDQVEGEVAILDPAAGMKEPLPAADVLPAPKTGLDGVGDAVEAAASLLPMLLLLLLALAALALGALALRQSYRNRSTLKVMGAERKSTALSANAGASEMLPASQSRWNTGQTEELFQALRQHAEPPEPLSAESARALWTLVHKALQPRDASLDGFNHPRFASPQPAHGPAPAPQAPRQSLAPQAPRPVDRLAAARNVVQRLAPAGNKGMSALASKGSFVRFRQENPAMMYFDVSSEGELLPEDGMRLPASRQWLFGLPDAQSGHYALFLGPATRTNGPKLAASARAAATQFGSVFEVDITGNRPALQSPAVVRVEGGRAEVLLQGKMTI
jgi:hypothetical protein